MLEKGSMINVKKVLGALLIIMAIGFGLNIDIIKELIMSYAFVSIGILVVSGYFLLRSGTQR